MKKTINYYSDCCNELMYDAPESDVCPMCKEHCTIETDEPHKVVLKRLAHAINAVLNTNEIVNEMDAMFDGGEWSQSEPDFKQLINDWGLDRIVLTHYCDIADEYSNTFYKHNKHSFNPWRWVSEMLHCIFMNGSLN